jgi:hypothetical protein
VMCVGRSSFRISEAFAIRSKQCWKGTNRGESSLRLSFTWSRYSVRHSLRDPQLRT